MLYMSSRQQIVTPGNTSCKYCCPKCLDIREMSRSWGNNSPSVECVHVWCRGGVGVEDPFKVSFYNASDERMGFPFVQCLVGVGFDLPRTISSTLPSVVFV